MVGDPKDVQGCPIPVEQVPIHLTEDPSSRIIRHRDRKVSNPSNPRMTVKTENKDEDLRDHSEDRE